MTETTPRRLLAVWTHADGRRIHVFTDCKVRYLAGSRPSMTRPGSMGDEWPVLWRRDVPNLTDAEWTARPVEDGWTSGEGAQ